MYKVWELENITNLAWEFGKEKEEWSVRIY